MTQHKIIFRKIRWKNFLSTGNSFSELDLDAAKTTLICGDSGTGKSTITDAVAFALYNCPYRQINKPDLVNAINEKELLVEIEFEIGTKKYLVRRGMRPALFEIYCDGKLIDQEANRRDYQKYLEKQILQMSYPAFTQIVLLGASNFTPFMRLPLASRRNIIESLLDIEIFSSMNTILKAKISENATREQDLAYKISLAEEKIKLKESYITKLQEDTSLTVKTQREVILFDLKEIRERQKFNRAARKQIDAMAEETKDIEKVRKKISSAKEVLAGLQGKEKRLKKVITFYESHDQCPTCQQAIANEFKDQEIKSNSESLGEIGTGISTATKILKDNSNRLALLEETNKKREDIGWQIYYNEKDIQRGWKEISRAKKALSDTKSPKSTNEQETRELETLNLELDALRKEKATIENNYKLFEVAGTLLKDTGVKAKIIKQYLPLMNKMVNSFLSTMNFFVTFTIDENFKETIKSRGMDTFQYGNFSDGERQRIDLALLFTWRAIAAAKNSLKTNLLFLDEVWDSSLSDSAADNVLELLGSEYFANDNIICISHKESVKNKFDRLIEVKKVRGFSVLQENTK